MDYAAGTPSTGLPVARSAEIDAMAPDLAGGELVLSGGGASNRFAFEVLCPPYGGGRAYVDRTGDGLLEPGAVLNEAAVVHGQRGMGCHVELRCAYPDEGREEPYQLWLSVDGEAWPEAAVRYSARCYRRAELLVAGRPVALQLVDAGTDGRYDDDPVWLDADGDHRLLPGETARPGETWAVGDARVLLVSVAASGAALELEILAGEVGLPPRPEPPKRPERAPATARPNRSARPGLALGTAAPSLAGLVWVRGEAPPSGTAQVLFFWATWCGPCKRALPGALRAAADRGLPLVAVSLDDDAASLERFLAGWSQPFADRVARAPGGFGGPIAQAFLVSGVPTTVFLDAEGRVVHYGVGGAGVAP